jgi:hypothetical protein
MPFGLHSVAGTFPALIDKLFTPDLEPYVFAYLDDIVINTPDFETHLGIIEQLLERLSKAGLTLKESKCEFCQPELCYLGYVVNRQGLKVDPSKVSAGRRRHATTARCPGRPPTNRDDELIPSVHTTVENNIR